MKAIFNGQVIAESDDVIPLEGNYYFPKSAVKIEFLKPTEHHTTCVWKGKAAYFTISVNDKTFDNGAWIYFEPSKKALNIKDHIAFYTPSIEIMA